MYCCSMNQKEEKEAGIGWRQGIWDSSIFWTGPTCTPPSEWRGSLSMPSSHFQAPPIPAKQTISPTRCKWWALLLLRKATWNAAENNLARISLHYFSWQGFPSPSKNHNNDLPTVFVHVCTYIMLHLEVTSLAASLIHDITKKGSREIKACLLTMISSIILTSSVQFNKYPCWTLDPYLSGQGRVWTYSPTAASLFPEQGKTFT